MTKNKEAAIRVWDKENNKWASVKNLLLLRCGDEKFYNIHLEEYKRFIIQRYTGVRDKNGRNIYEGDLVNFSFRIGDNDWENETNEEVFFEEGVFYFGRKHYFAMNDVNFSKLSLEVVGNIYENQKA